MNRGCKIGRQQEKGEGDGAADGEDLRQREGGNVATGGSALVVELAGYTWRAKEEELQRRERTKVRFAEAPERARIDQTTKRRKAK